MTTLTSCVIGIGGIGKKKKKRERKGEKEKATAFESTCVING